MSEAELSVDAAEHIIGCLVHLLSTLIPCLSFGEVPGHALDIGKATIGVCFMNGVPGFLKKVRCLLIGVDRLLGHPALQGDMPECKRAIAQPLEMPACTIEVLSNVIARLSTIKLT